MQRTKENERKRKGKGKNIMSEEQIQIYEHRKYGPESQKKNIMEVDETIKAEFVRMVIGKRRVTWKWK